MNTNQILDTPPTKVVVKEIDTTSHAYRRNKYIEWFFKKKQNYVILRQFKDSMGNVKLYIVLPVREREFVETKMDLFNVNILKDSDFPFDIKNIESYETIYSGNMDNFQAFPKYLNTIKFVKKNPSSTYRWGKQETVLLFKDYTKTKIEQQHSFTLVAAFIEPALSITSIFRLIQTKYITLVAVTVKEPKTK